MSTINIKSLIIIFAITITYPVVVYGQTEFKVLFVKPSTVFINEKALQIGDTFFEDEALIFSNKSDLIKVCSNDCSKTKILLGGVFKASKVKSLKEYLIATKGLSTRGEEEQECIPFEILKKYSKIGILGEFRICLDTKIYSDEDKSYFIFQYEKDKQLGEYKLLSWEDNLIIDEKVLDSISSQTNSNDFKLTIKYYSNQDRLDFNLIKDLSVSYINPEVITSELKLILIDPEVEMKDKQELVRSYLTIRFPEIEFLQLHLDKLLF